MQRRLYVAILSAGLFGRVPFDREFAQTGARSATEKQGEHH